MGAPPMPTVLIIPTGIGCQHGGFAGDGLPVARLLAAASGCLITHPNVLNAASLYWPAAHIHYTEGWALDRFCQGEMALRPHHRHCLGLLLDGALEPELLERHRQVAAAARFSLGLPIGPEVVTPEPLGVRLEQGVSGISWGGLSRVDVLLEAGHQLRHRGATAVAVVTRFPDESPTSSLLQNYRHGRGVDALAGAEAVISHLLVRELGLPCAHAPAVCPLPLLSDVDPRAAAEELGYTFLPSVLVGLSRAPQLISAADARMGDLLAHQVGALVAPHGALGGPAVLAAAERAIPILAVHNPSQLEVTAAALGLDGVINVANYQEAAGVVLSLREGLDPGAFQRPLGQTDRN
ncbi:MAG: hypothetical protein TH68_02965 [Candidatus Synechococcus spongiarum 142]|uniref:DUF3326 domain-containing protein n=1 Tax=Candidatus Synechococcus spongiarum 142 TaxID=1608213 RepID=A0A6N3X5P9_9SYNE|nr:MAG: hypothetical protein TH68_02965 [Candidatus Synechococcus spongiarum 142]